MPTQKDYSLLINKTYKNPSTDNIEDAFAKISRTHPQFLHPNLNTITLRPWGAKEFALRDNTNVCVIIQQW